MNSHQPKQVLHHPAQKRPSFDSVKAHCGVGLILINYNTAKQTIRCLESLQNQTHAPDWILVLDNASEADNLELLLANAPSFIESSLSIYSSDENLGFAAGSNFLIEELQKHADFQQVVLLNNDAVAMPELIEKLSNALKPHPDKQENSLSHPIGLSGGRMHKLHQPEQVDTLGISLYASLMPADRQTLADPYLGPTGGCCAISRELLEHVKSVCGYVFDHRFFCYSEDTDLVLRSILLGYRPIYIDQLLALHEGQASSGGQASSFVIYHGIRNTLWMHLKLMPASVFIQYGLLYLLAQTMTLFGSIIEGRGKIVFSAYRDAFKNNQLFRSERLLFQSKENSLFIQNHIVKRFFREGHFFSSLARVLGTANASKK